VNLSRPGLAGRTDFGGAAKVDECPRVVAWPPEDVGGLEVAVGKARLVEVV
jgi:hypothetical protein